MSNLNPFIEPGAGVSIISGTITAASGAQTIGAVSVISGAVSVSSGTIGVSGLFAGFSGAQKFLSGGGAVSGAQPMIPFVYDFSGAQWTPTSTAISGSTVQQVWVASGVVTASVASGAVSVASGAISIVSGSITVNSGTITASVSSGAVSVTSGAISVVSGSVQLYDGLARVYGPGDATVANNALYVNTQFMAYDVVGNAWNRVRTTTSGDAFRLRVSTEGQAPTYTVNVPNIALQSGGGVGPTAAPMFAMFNYGSGTAIQSGSAYKVKSLFITPDPANAIISGQAISLDVIRFTAFSGGGTAIGSGYVTAMDTADPVFSGTLAGPTFQRNALSGMTWNALFFRYVTTTAGIPAGNYSAQVVSGSAIQFDVVAQAQMTNLIAQRLVDTKEIIIRSGYGLGITQSSGFSYTQVFSGTYNISMTYSVEGMQYTA